MLLPDHAVMCGQVGSWSVEFGRPLDGPRLVVLVTDPQRVALQLEEARNLLAEHSKVTIIGRGVTLPATLPSWLQSVEQDKHVVLSEIDAYLPPDKRSLTAELETAVQDWLTQTFPRPAGEPDASALLWSAACHRLLIPMFTDRPLVAGIAVVHAKDTILADRGWTGFTALSRMVEKVRAAGPAVSAAKRWHPAASLSYVAALGAAIAKLTIEYARSSSSLTRIRLHGKRHTSPRYWLGVIGDWPWASRSLFDVARDLRDGGNAYGVLLHTSLLPGTRSTADAEDRKGGEILPILDLPEVGEVAAEQCALPETLRGFLRALSRGTRKSMVAARRLAERGPVVRFLENDVDLQTRATAYLLTIDVLRAELAIEATVQLLERRNLAGSTVLWSHASAPGVVGPDLLLQESGVTTVEIVHGALAEPLDNVVHEKSFSSMKLLWTRAESAYLRNCVPPHQQLAGGFVPRRVARKPDGARRASNVLLLTNYATPLTGVFGRSPRIAYQHMFFDAVARALNAQSRAVRVRWRPHPADDAVETANVYRRFPAFERSVSLDEDMRWADVIITSLSSVLVEALLSNTPLLVHDIPAHERDVLMTLFPKERRFSDGEELATRLEACLRALEGASPDAFKPDSEMRRLFFGPSEEPAPLAEFLKDRHCASFS